MTPKEIKARLREKNLRQIDLVKKWHLPSGTVAQLVNRKMKSERLDRRLARLLGVTVEELTARPNKADDSNEGQAA